MLTASKLIQHSGSVKELGEGVVIVSQFFLREPTNLKKELLSPVHLVIYKRINECLEGIASCAFCNMSNNLFLSRQNLSVPTTQLL